jgi:hypothetical protein
MATLAEIRETPVVLDTGNGRVHESVFRSWHCLRKVREYLLMARKGDRMPPEVLLEIIDDLMDSPGKDYVLNGQHSQPDAVGG